MPNPLPAIGKTVGNIGKFGGEWLMNIADPQRQQFQRDMALLREKSFLENQNWQTQQSYSYKAAMKEIEAQDARGRSDRQHETFRDTTVPAWLRTQSAEREGYQVPRIPTPQGFNPAAQYLLRTDPNAWDVPMTPLQDARAFQASAAGQKSLEPRAPNQYDFFPEMSFEERIRALGGAPPAPRAPNKFDFFPQGFQFSPGQAAIAGGGVHTPSTGTDPMVPMLKALQDNRLKQLGQTVTTVDGITKMPVTRTTAPIDDDVLAWIEQQLRKSAGAPETLRRSSPLTPAAEQGLDKLLQEF